MSDEQAVQQQEQLAESAPQGETEPSAASAAAEPTETHSEPEPEAPKSRKGGVQRRIDELTRKAYLAEAEARFYRELAEKKALGEKQEAPVVAAPQQEQYANEEEYLQALRAWDREQLKAELKAELDQHLQSQQQLREMQQRWREREAAVAAKYADYADVSQQGLAALGAASGPAVSAIAHALQFSEHGPQLLYHIGQHAEELDKLLQLHPTQAVIALGRLEARLLHEQAPSSGEKAAPLTTAPKPPTPLRKPSPGPAIRPDQPESDTLSDEEWLAARHRQLREKYGR